MTVEELLERMSLEEFREWQIFERVEPFGDRRADVLTGMICATLANIHRGEKTKPFTPWDFISHLWEIEETAPVSNSREMPLERQIDFFKALVLASGNELPN